MIQYKLFNRMTVTMSTSLLWHRPYTSQELRKCGSQSGSADMLSQIIAELSTRLKIQLEVQSVLSAESKLFLMHCLALEESERFPGPIPSSQDCLPIGCDPQQWNVPWLAEVDWHSLLHRRIPMSALIPVHFWQAAERRWSCFSNAVHELDVDSTAITTDSR